MLPLVLYLSAAASVAHALSHGATHILPSMHSVPGTNLPPASFSAPIVARTPRGRSKAEALHSILSAGRTAHTALLMGAQYDFEYLVNATIGGQHFSLIVDTGSSDTWLAAKGFSCYNLTGHPEPASTCNFGSNGFDSRHSKTYRPYTGASFAVAYGDGEYLSGSAAFDTVTVGGLTVTHQEIGIVSRAAWVGDGINTGLLGLAYPSLTSVKNKHGANMKYNPFFFNAVAQRKVAHPYFSLALNRGTDAGKHTSEIDPHLGYLAFGGIPPVPVSSTTATVPLQAFTNGIRTPSSGAGASYFYYAVNVQSYVFPNSTSVATANQRTIIDSGTTLNILPSATAQAYNAGWGNATWVQGSYYVDCAAQAPPFTVVLGGQNFTIDPRDLVVPVGRDGGGNDICVSGIQDGGQDMDGAIFILGDVFLHNVVTTFDIHNNRMTFTQRQNY